MTKRAIYFTNGSGADAAIGKGLEEAGCEVLCTPSLSEAIQLLKNNHAAQATPLSTSGSSSHVSSANNDALILVATVKAGAIPLLTLLREQGVELPPTLVFDEEGRDVHTIIKALQLGVREYVLASDPEMQRRLSARLLAERVSEASKVEQATSAPVAESGPAPATELFEWDPIGRVIHIGEGYVRLSSVEGRIFDLLLENRGHTVPVADLVRGVLMRPNLDVTIGARRLRPHIMRLRRKLEHHPALGMRIVNMRGAGYMLI